MNFEGIYHVGTEPMLSIVNKDTIEIRLKTGKDIKEVFIYENDPFINGILGGKEKWSGIRKEVKIKKELKHHYIWTIFLKPKFKRCKYYFEISDGVETFFYTEEGIVKREDIENPLKSQNYFIMPWINENDVNLPPAWVKSCIWYQIFPDRFNRAGDKNSKFKTWKCESPSTKDLYGGNLKGIIEKLPYLKELGITGLYLTPIFKSKSNHKYDTDDYYEIDPDFGTKDDLKNLVKLAHKMGIRVMLDGVFNHTGTEFFMWKDLMEKGEASKYKDCYFINEYPVTLGKSTKDGRYYSFAFSDRMPKINTNNEIVQKYFLDLVSYLIDEYEIDGLRLDVGNEVSHDFLKKLRIKAKSKKNDFYLLGEIWHNSISWLRGDEYDSVMNYPFSSGIKDFFLLDNQLDDFRYKLTEIFNMYRSETNKVIFNLLDSHDTERLITTFQDLNKFMGALALLFTLPGSPCIYYGTEIALTGKHDPDCRKCMPWDEIDNGKYFEITEKIKQLIQLRKDYNLGDNLEFSFNKNIKGLLQIYLKEANITIIINRYGENLKILNREILFENNFNNGILSKNGTVIIKGELLC